MMKLYIFSVVFLLAIGCNHAQESTLVNLNDDNWEQILTGEWMIEFFAPWCPACRNLQPVWLEFSTWGKDLGIQVAQVDITHSPGLSGRFLIAHLPSIFHVKDGLFRQYRGSRSKEDFLSFVEEKKYEELDPLTWQSPSSIPMAVVSQFYRVSMVLRNVLTVMEEDYGIPSWGGYLIFGLLTVLIGLILGLLLVCIIDFIYPPPAIRQRPPAPLTTSQASEKDAKDKDDKSGDDEDLEDDEIEEGTETQSESQDDSQASDGETVEADRKPEVKEPTTNDGNGETTRRRKARRAD